MYYSSYSQLATYSKWGMHLHAFVYIIPICIVFLCLCVCVYVPVCASYSYVCACMCVLVCMHVCVHACVRVCRAWNNSRPLAIFRLIFTIRPSKSNLIGHIYCTLPMGKPLLVYTNVTAFKKWPTNFKLLLQVLACAHALLAKSKGISKKKLLWLTNYFHMWCHY